MYAAGELAPIAGDTAAPSNGGVGGTSGPAADGAPAPVMKQRSSSGGTTNNRIDPSQIPRPAATDVSEQFFTRASLGQLPPPASSAFHVVDDGNCSPRMLRLTLNHIVSSPDQLASASAAFGAIVQPLAEPLPGEAAVPVVHPGDEGPLRCGRCGAYVNPYFRFVERGSSFLCNFCGFVSPTPRDQYSELDGAGYRRDHDSRPELRCGAVEYVAPRKYQAREPKPPPLVVVLEVSYGAIASGITQTIITALGAVLPTLPVDTRVALVTYNDTVHFYRPSSESGGSVGFFVSPDLADVALPLPPEVLLGSLEDVHAALALVPELFNATKRPDAAFGAAIHTAHQLLGPTGGRLIAFQHSQPALGPLKLTQRDDARSYGTDKEKALYAPAEPSWTALAAALAASHVCASTFHLTTGNFVDIASMAALSRATGGQLYYYPEALPEQRDIWGPKLEAELSRNLTRPFGYEGVMRCRVSKGLRVEGYLLGTQKVGDVDVDLPGIDADSSFAVTFKLDEKLDGEGAAANPAVQCAVLYTTAAGERRIRVLTTALSATPSMASLYRFADLDAIVGVVLRQVAHGATGQTLQQLRESVASSCVNILHTYRRACASSTSSGQLILPEALKLLPLYALALTKGPILRAGTDVRADERSALLASATRMPVVASVGFVYPRLFSVRELLEGETDALPSTRPLSHDKFEPDDAYLLDDSRALYLYFGAAAPADLVHDLLGVETLEGCDAARLRLFLRDNARSARLHHVLGLIRGQRLHVLQAVHVVLRKSALESRFLSLLYEDRAQASMTYTEYLCHIHRQIQSKMASA